MIFNNRPKLNQREKENIKKIIEKANPQSYPSYIPPSSSGLDVSYIKPQYNMSSLNRNMFFPGTPQSLPPPPQLPQILPPPHLPQIMPPPLQQPINISFDNMFGGMMDSMMPREYGFKANSYLVDVLDEDVMDALPPAEKDKYLENKMMPQIQQEIKDITFPSEDKKQEFITNTISIKTAKEWGTKHANKLIPYESKYNGNEYYKANYIARLQEIINQDSLKTRGGVKENTIENKNKAKELLKRIGVDIKPALNVSVPTYVPPPATPPRERPALVSSPVAKSKKPAVIEETSPPAAPKPPPPPPPPLAAAASAGKGPPPPPPPPPKQIVSTTEAETKKKQAASAALMLKELVDKVENDDDPEEKANKKEATSKTQGTKDGKNLVKIKKQWINYVGYSDNYEKNLKTVIDDTTTTEENKTKAKDLLKTLDEQYKLDANEDIPDPTTTTKLKIVKPRFTSNEAYKKEYKKRGNKLLKKIKESAVLDIEDKKNIKLIEDYFKLFD